jgi:ubiquinone/menaquinone biosynthesis C-methylase UbiE
MNHKDHVNLLRKGIMQPGGVWADLGAGEGAFTLALAELIGQAGTIYAVDKSRRALQQLERTMRQRFPEVTLHSIRADFTNPLPLPLLNGLVMANSLHFLRHKDELVQQLRTYLQPDGRFILIEYNVDRGNMWVPYPLSYETWTRVARRNGFQHTALLATRPSRFLGEIYAAASW